MSSCPFHTAVTSWASSSPAGDPFRGCILYSHLTLSLDDISEYHSLQAYVTEKLPGSISSPVSGFMTVLASSTFGSFFRSHVTTKTLMAVILLPLKYAGCGKNQKISHFLYTLYQGYRRGINKCCLRCSEAYFSYYSKVHL